MMKKLMLVLLCLLTLSLGVNCFAEATNSSDWKLDYYVDEFKLPTDKAYVANAKPIEGTFSNSAVDDAPLTVVVIVNQSEFSFQLYENGRKVKNSGGSDRSYTVIMLDDARQKTPLSGIMKANGGELLNLDSADVETVRTAFAQNTALSFYIEEVHNPSTNYLFTVRTEGFTDKFEDLINSIHERDYQQAVAFFEGGNYDAALKIFAELDDYKDSSEWKPKYQELKYSEAETLLAEGDPEGAIDAFLTVKDYRDAEQRLVEIYYNYAEDLLATDEFAKAAILFGRAGDYKDAAERSRALWDRVAERKTIAVGLNHNVGLKSDGTVVGAGDNNYCQLNISAWTDIVAIAAGLQDTIGLKSDGTVTLVESTFHIGDMASSLTGIRVPN